MLPKARQEKLVVRKVPDETLVYDLESTKVHCLNATTALVWEHCDGQTSIAQLAGLLHEELGVPQAEAVVQLALEQLGRRKLLEQQVPALSQEARLARRDFLRRLAVAAVALPLVMTITARHARAACSNGNLANQNTLGICCLKIGPNCTGPCTSGFICCAQFVSTGFGSCVAGTTCPADQPNAVSC